MAFHQGVNLGWPGMLYLNIYRNVVFGPKLFQSFVVVNQQLSLVQLHILKIEARQLEQAQSDNCDELWGAESDELNECTKPCSTKATYS